MGLYNFKIEDAEGFARHMMIPARRKGNELIFRNCPFCHMNSNEKEKFSINLTNGQFHCFRASCGAKGNMITLSKEFNYSLGNDVDEYYREIKQYRKFKVKEKPKPKPAAVEYLMSRGISEAVAERYHITTQKEHENVLVFPFYDEHGILTFIKYRKTDFDKDKDTCKEWCEKDCKTILFGMDQCDMENDTLVLTEGQIDSLSLAEAGIVNAVSVPTGAKGFTWIPHCWDFLGKFQKLIVFGDFEHEHITLLDEMQARFHGQVLHVREEDYLGCKDANEILKKHGTDALINAVNNAAPVKHPQIVSLADVEKVELSKMERITSGMQQLDRILGGFYFGQLILLTGERGEGKSTLASQFGTFAAAAGHSVFFYSGELMNWYFKAWFDAQVTGKNHINKLQSESGYVSYSIDPSVQPLIEKWYRDRVYIYDRNVLGNDSEEEALIPVMETAIKQYGCRVLVVDNLMTAMMDDVSIDQYRQQTIFVNQLARIAKQYNVLIFLIAHPRKRTGQEFDNDDIAGSSNITNLVDVVMRYARPKGKDIPPDTAERELKVYKNRLTGQTNRVGIKLFYEPESKRISESGFCFDWELGWEERYEQMEFIPLADGVQTPFDEEADHDEE